MVISRNITVIILLAKTISHNPECLNAFPAPSGTRMLMPKNGCSTVAKPSNLHQSVDGSTTETLAHARNYTRNTAKILTISQND